MYGYQQKGMLAGMQPPQQLGRAVAPVSQGRPSFAGSAAQPPFQQQPPQGQGMGLPPGITPQRLRQYAMQGRPEYNRVQNYLEQRRSGGAPQPGPTPADVAFDQASQRAAFQRAPQQPMNAQPMNAQPQQRRMAPGRHAMQRGIRRNRRVMNERTGY